MKEEIASVQEAIDNLFNEGKLSVEFKNHLKTGIKNIAINLVKEQTPGGIDLRTIKCACGKEECRTGISFDSDEKYLLLRFHFLDEEVHMKLTEKEKDQLIYNLVDAD